MMLSLGCMQDVRERPTAWHSGPLSIFQTNVVFWRILIGSLYMA